MNLCKKQHRKVSAVQDSKASGKDLGTIILPRKLYENLPVSLKWLWIRRGVRWFNTSFSILSGCHMLVIKLWRAALQPSTLEISSRKRKVCLVLYLKAILKDHQYFATWSTTSKVTIFCVLIPPWEQDTVMGSKGELRNLLWCVSRKSSYFATSWVLRRISNCVNETEA